MYKGSIKFLTALVAVGTLAACGSGGSTSTSAEPEAASSSAAATSEASAVPAGEPLEIALITNDQFDPFYMTINAGAQDEAAAQGVNVTWNAPDKTEVSAQTAVVESVLARKPDGIVMSAIDANAMVGVFQKIKDAGIPVVVVDADINDPSLRLSAITSDNVRGGEMAAETMAELLGGSGQVSYDGYVPGIKSVDDRLAGWQAGIARLGLESVGETYSKGDLKEIAANAAAVMQKNPDLGGFFGSWTNPAIGLATAVQAADKVGEVKVIGFDASPDEVALLKQGVISALIVQKAYDMGTLGVRDIVEYRRDGVTPEASQKLDMIVATTENVDDPEVQKYLYRTAG